MSELSEIEFLLMENGRLTRENEELCNHLTAQKNACSRYKIIAEREVKRRKEVEG